MNNNELPNGWRFETLGNIADVNMGQSPPSSTYNQESIGLPFFQGKAEFGDMYPSVVKYCCSPLKIAEKSDILISVRAPVGPVNISATKCCIGRGLSAVRAKEGKAVQLYLFYYLRLIEKKLSGLGQGSTFTAIGKKDIENIMIPVPPHVETQMKIATILQHAYNLKQKREQANQMTNKILQAVFLQMFGDGNFTREPIRRHIIKTEVRDPRKKPNEYFKYIDIAGIDNKAGKIVEIKTILGKDAPSRARKIVRKDDVIVSTVRPNLNATALVPFELDNQICSTGFCVLHCKSSLNPRYLYVFTRRTEFIDVLSSQMKGASYPAVTNDDVLNVEIPIPSIELQNKFASTVERIEAFKEKQDNSTKEITELFNSLMSEAFKGELVS